MKQHSSGRTLKMIGMVTLAILAVPVVVAGSGDCFSVVVPAQVVLPDGSVHLPGALRLCFERQLNPVAEMQEISVAGMKQGLFVAKIALAESKSARAVVLFHRNDNDDWILIGFSRPGRSPRERSTRVQLTAPLQLQELIARGLNERPGLPPSVTIVAPNDARNDKRAIMMAAR